MTATATDLVLVVIVGCAAILLAVTVVDLVRRRGDRDEEPFSPRTIDRYRDER